MRTLVWLNGVVFVALAACAAAVGCGEPFTLTGSGGTGGTGGTGGMPTTTTTGGMGGTGGGGDMTGGGGTGGMKPCVPGDLSTCGAGEYCRADNSQCESCSEIDARFVFGQPQSLEITLPASAKQAWFPRVGTDGNLYFSYLDPQNSDNEDIGVATPEPKNPLKWNMAVPRKPPGAQPATRELAPLFLADTTGFEPLIKGTSIESSKPLLIFDNQPLNQSTPPKVNGADSIAQEALKITGIGSANAYQAAFAPLASPPRIWFMTTASLYTATPNEAMPNDTPVAMKLYTNVGSGCQAKGDLAPWVTQDGKFMLFQTVALDDVCTTTPTQHYLYYTPLESDGQQKGWQAPPPMSRAKPLFPNDTSNYQTPSLSPDLCVLYFTAEDTTNGKTLMGAIRE